MDFPTTELFFRLVFGTRSNRHLSADYRRGQFCQWGYKFFGVFFTFCFLLFISDFAYGSFTISAGTVTLSDLASLDVSEDIVIEASGTFNAAAGLINVGRNWDNSGIFNAQTSTVTFYSTLVSTITGNTTFYCFRCETASKQISFQSGSTQTVAGVFSLTGALGNLVKLRSTVDGLRWSISFPSGSQEVNFVDVRDSNALLNKVTDYNGLDSGNNNANWVFIQDQGPPAAISDLTALTGTENDGDIILNWTAPGNDGTSGNFNGLYYIKWSTNNLTNFDSPPSPFYQIYKSSYIVATQGQTFLITGLNPGTTYYFAIKTKDPVDNWSTWSTVGVNTANFAKALDLPPSAPPSVSAIANSSYTINVSWEKPVPTFVDDLDKYFVYRATFVFTSTTTANVVHIATVSHPTNVYLDTGLTINVTYYYRVVAYDQGNQGGGLFSSVLYSGLSQIASAVPLPTDPAKVRVSVVWDNRSSDNKNNYGVIDGIEDADGIVTWDWPFIPDGGTIVNYFIEVSTDINFSFFISSATLPPTVSTYTVSNLPRGYYAYARVRAKNDEGITGAWTLSDGIYIDRKTIDGNNADWSQNYSAVVNSITVAGGDALWRDAIGDQRTDQASSSQLDISSFAITTDEYNLYVFCAFASTAAAGFDGRNFIQILVDNDQTSTERVFRGRNYKYEDSYAAKYVPWEYLCEIVTGNDMFRAEDSFFSNRRYGQYSENNSQYYYEVAIPLSYLGGKEKFLGKTVNFTIATFWNAGGADGSIGDWTGVDDAYSNIVDAITSAGPNTWNEVSDKIVDYYLAVSFASTGSVVSASGVMSSGSSIPDEPEPSLSAPPSALDYVLYNIFIDAWYNGDTSNDDIADTNDYGGDFQGVIDKVNYLNDLGINVGYFGPPTEFGGGIWGFNIDDAYKHETKFGGTSKYMEMVKTLKNHNIKAMIDWVCGQVGSQNSPTARKNPNFFQPEQFGYGTKQEYAEPRAFWLNNLVWYMSICDAIRYDNPKFWDNGFGPEAYEFNLALRKITDRWDPQLYIMGEIPTGVDDINPFTGDNGPMLHGGLNMLLGGYKNDRSSQICSWVRPGNDQITTASANSGITYQDTDKKNSFSINPVMMENHDEMRFINRGRADDGQSWGYDSQVGYMTAITVSGPVDIFYGGELGLEGPYDGTNPAKMDVNGNVRPMPFERVSQSPWNGIRSAIRKTIQAKVNFAPLRSDPKQGGRTFLSFTPDPSGDDVMVFRRNWGSSDYVICAMNRNASGRTITNLNTGIAQSLTWKDWLSDETFTSDASGIISSLFVGSHYGRILVKGGYDWANVTGTVTNASGQAVSGAIVDIDGKSHWTITTDANGYYSLSGTDYKVLMGNHTVHCWAPGYQLASQNVYISTGAGVNNNVSFTLSVDNTAPAAPTTLSGRPRNKAAMIFWQPNTEADIQSYLIYRSTTPIPDGSNPVPLFEVFKTYYYDNNFDGELDSSGNVVNRLQNGTTYYYRIRAVDRNGNKSGFSNQIAVVPRAIKVKFWLDARDFSGTISSAAISGGALAFGNANYGSWPAPVQMDKVADKVFEKEFEFDDTTFLEYKYLINGIWEGDVGSGTLFLDGPQQGHNRGELWKYENSNGVNENEQVPDIEIVDEGDGTMTLADVWRYYYDRPPRAPEGLQITAGPNMLTVGWSKNLEPDLAYYTIYRDAGSGYSEIAKVGKEAINYVDINLTNNVTYYYKITATDRKGNTSAESAVVFSFPRARDSEAPATPTGLVAYGAGNAGLSAIRIEWNPNYEGDLAGYNLHRSTIPDFSVALENKLNYTLISPVSNYYLDSAISPMTTYYYKLVAVDSSGNSSPPSSQLRTLLVPITFEVDLGNISASKVGIGGNTSPLTWSSFSYLSKLANSTSYYITLGFIAGTTIQYKYIYDDVWEGDFNTGSRNREYVIPAASTTVFNDWEENPEIVANPRVYPGLNCAYLYWDRNTAAEDLSGYNIYRSVPPATNPTIKVNSQPVSYSQPYTVTGLVAGNTYYFAVKVIDSGATVLESTAAIAVSVLISSPVYVNFGVPYGVGQSTGLWGDSSRLKMYLAIQSSAAVSVWNTADRANITNGLLEMSASGDGTYRATVPLIPSPDPYNFLFFARTSDNPPPGLIANTEYYDTVPSTGYFSVYSSSTGAAPPSGVLGYFNPAGSNRDARRFLYLPTSLTPGTTLYVFANFASSPTAPTYIQAVAGNQKATLYWSAPYGAPWIYPPPELTGNIPNGGGENMKAVDVIAGGCYQIYFATYNPGDFNAYKSSVVVSGGTFNFTFSGLTNGVTYYYILCSSDTFRGQVANNYSNFSATVSVCPSNNFVLARIRVNRGSNSWWKSVRKSIAFQEGTTVSAWDAPGRSNMTPTGQAVNMSPATDDPDEQEFSVNLIPGTTYNFIFFAYSTFSITGLIPNLTYYDTVPNSGTGGMVSSTSTVSITNPARAWCANVGATGDSRRLLCVFPGLPPGTTVYVWANFSSSPSAIVLNAVPSGPSSVDLSWIPYGAWGTGGESLKAIDVIAGGYYYIWRSSVSAAGPYSLVASTNTMNWTDTGLIEGQRYWYVVVSSDAYSGDFIPNMYRGGAPEFSSADGSAIPLSPLPVYFKVEAIIDKKNYGRW